MSEPVLDVVGLTVTYGAVTAVDKLSLSVGPGELVGLIGPNGAGKTSAIDAITGFTPATGRVQLLGHDISKLNAYRRARGGLRRTWQSLELFDDLTVEENLQVSRDRRRNSNAHETAVDTTLAFLGIEADRRRFPGELSYGTRKLLGVGRALVANAPVIAMDEPAAGLDSTESAALGHRLRELVDHGQSLLLVDHDMNLVLDVCDRIYVLDFGRLIAHGAPSEVLKNPEVVTAYLGTSDTTRTNSKELTV